MQIVNSYLRELGFEEAATKLYETLIQKGAMTILEASRATGIERTLLYRMIEDLRQRGLIEELLEHKSRRILAAPPHQIKLLVERERSRAERLVEEFEGFAQVVESVPGSKSTQVKYYRGVEGIKQILWNETRARMSAVGYTHRNLEEVVGKKYFAQYARELERQKIVFRDLRTDSFLRSTLESDYRADPIMTGFWRYIPEKVLNLTHNMDVYNNVVAMYYWEDNDVFGVEICNQKIADTQRSIFEALWELAKKYKLPHPVPAGDQLNWDQKANTNRV